jgi:hypothetical protein
MLRFKPSWAEVEQRADDLTFDLDPRPSLEFMDPRDKPGDDDED